MKKAAKYTTSFSGQEITFTVDKNMETLKGRVLAPKKLADANKALRKLKSLPSFLNNK
jgi:hypothetical protein